MLFLLGLAGFFAAYAGYAYFLGGIDGLPQLPEKYITSADGDFDYTINKDVSPTLKKLEIAFQYFNPSCPESRDSTTYQIRLEMPQPDDSRILLATGPMEIWKDQPRRVTVSPISVAIFGKAKPKTEKMEGDQEPITTVHADRAVLEFDKPISSPQDMSRSRLLGVELIGDPEVLSHDKRKGRVTITSNQGYEDPEKWLVIRTPGPVYYTAPTDPTKPPPPDVPQIRSTAAMVMENRANMPRPLRGKGLPIAEARTEDLHAAAAVRDMLLGIRTSPPTVTAEGFKLYLNPTEPVAGKHASKGVQTGFSGLRKLELTEKVAVSLWTGAEAPGAESKAKPGAGVDPPFPAAGIIGAVTDGATLANRLHDMTLVTIETLGPFTYDTATSSARFRIAPHANPNLSNYVVVNRLSALGTTDSLVCDVLDLEFEEALVKAADAPTAKPNPTPPNTTNPGFKTVLATGRQVLVTGDAEQFMAQGTELKYSTDKKTGVGTTILLGNTVTVVRDRNKMIAGTPARPATLTMLSTPPPKGSAGSATSTVNIQGPGRVDFIEPGAKEYTGAAEWADSLTFDKAKIGTKEFDRLIFVRGSFKDTKGEFNLTGDLIHLWLEPNGSSPVKSAGAAMASPMGSAKPVLLQAVGHVQGGSETMVIEKTDTLNVWFRDGEPVKPKAVAVAAAPPTVGGPPTAAPPPGPAPDAPVKQPPVHLSARKIDAWMVRSTDVASKSTSYALELANCIDRVEVHQAPVEPKKNPRGLDVTAARLNLKGLFDEFGAHAGYYVTMDGEGDKLAEVYFESVSLTGPKVTIDQAKNEAHVSGRGKLRMPTGSALIGPSGSPTPGPTPPPTNPGMLDVLWSEEMHFTGAPYGVAKFTGKVQAEQKDPFPTVVPVGEEATEKRSWLVCHKLDVRFDRPVYFNQTKKPTESADGGPKVANVSCYPQADDELIRGGAAPGEKVSSGEEVKKRDGSIVSSQRLTALDLEFRALERESVILATGPGEIRVLRLGAKDVAKATPGSGPPPSTAAKPTVEEQEMKLTLVTFKSQLRINDQGKKFQKATFLTDVEVFHVPSANLNLELARHALPARGLLLTCQDKMDVTTYQREGKPAEQHMLAEGNADVKTDEYSGRGSTITYDGKMMELAGKPPRDAYVYRNNKDGTVQTFVGKRIIYDPSAKERIKITQWADGTFGK